MEGWNWSMNVSKNKIKHLQRTEPWGRRKVAVDSLSSKFIRLEVLLDSSLWLSLQKYHFKTRECGYLKENQLCEYSKNH